MGIRFFNLFLVSLIVTLTSCSKPPQVATDRVTVQLKWVHQSQFAGFYVAQEKGYYADEHIDVTFLEGGSQVDIAAPLIEGTAQFAVLSPEDILIKQSENIPLTAVATIYQRSAVVFLTRAESGIVHPWELSGKTVAFLGKAGSVRDFEFQFRAMMEKLHLDITQVKGVPYDPNYTGFIGHTVDVTPAYLTGGVVRLTNKGLKLNIIWPGDYGIHCYSDTLATIRELIDRNPDLVLRFVRASLKGWRDAVGDPKAAVDVVMKYAQTKDYEIQSDMMSGLLPLVHTGEYPEGWMGEVEWKNMADMLEAQKIIKHPIENISAVFTTRFLKTIYGDTVH